MNSTISVSPRIGMILTQVTETPNLEAAIWQVLTEYLALKCQDLRTRIDKFESASGMTYQECVAPVEANSLDRDAFSYEVESLHWEWEEAKTLLKHYEELRAQWT